eukprot:GHVL01019935.1.p1 GENE.GHVL01019935.1~~GHVL01019935.1.p1  ORF type:complete len:416 (+),score=97.19 GHVL01019935.1:71-1318(+)
MKRFDQSKILHVVRNAEDLQNLDTNMDAGQVRSCMMKWVVPEKKQSKNIIIPLIKKIKSDPEGLITFTRPDSYIRCLCTKDMYITTRLSDNTEVSYDIQADDIAFLQKLNQEDEVTEEDFIKMIDVWENASNFQKNPLSSQEAAHLIHDENYSNRAKIAIWQYWQEKRSRLKRPLLRQFWPSTPMDDTSVYGVFRPRKKEKRQLRRPKKSAREALSKVQILGRDIQDVLVLIEKVKKREMKKMSVLNIDALVFDQQRCEMLDSNYVNEKWIKRKTQIANELMAARQKSASMHRDLDERGMPSLGSDDDDETVRHRGSSSPTGGRSVLPVICLSPFSDNFPPTFRARHRVGRGGRRWIDTVRIMDPQGIDDSSVKTNSNKITDITDNNFSIKEVSTVEGGHTLEGGGPTLEGGGLL